MKKISVFLIEDNRLLREGLEGMLEEQEDMEVIARAKNGDTLLKLKKMKKEPDVVLLDMGLGSEDCFELMRTMRNELPNAGIIAMDVLPEHGDILQFVQAGGSGLVHKGATFEYLLYAIRAVARGEKVLPNLLTRSLFTQIVDFALKSGLGISTSSVRLTARERQIVNLISKGLSNKDIAQKLCIATYTVKNHVHNILEKLALNSRLQIATFARMEGIDHPDRDSESSLEA
jgi:two-component system nitrate/nitrite response regulator NarL